MSGEKAKGGRFDYIKYDQEAIATQDIAKELVSRFEAFVEQCVKCPRSKALALTKVEEAYMWVGKGIRNDQISRTHAYEILEERVSS